MGRQACLIQVVCIRFVDNDLRVYKEVVGLYSLESTSAETIVSMIKDVILWTNLRIGMCCGQRYDGASNISGSNSGVATKIASLERMALYRHCYGHVLNLATQDALRHVNIMGDTLYEIMHLIKKSPKPEAII